MIQYTEVDLNPPRHREPCPGCGSKGDRLVVRSFGRAWKIVCTCGYEFEHGRGVMPGRTDG